MIDHKDTGRRIKVARRELMEIAKMLSVDDRTRKGSKAKKYRPTDQLYKAVEWIDRARGLLDTWHSHDDKENFKPSTYYGELP